jgi:DNA-binding Lrp family transcriptional regulator
VDSKDFRLLVALYDDVRQSYQSLGRHISLSAPAARDRLKRLQSHGILQGFMLSIDPSVFGRDDLLLFFRGKEFTRRQVEKALAAPNVAWIGWKLDGGLTVGVWSKDRVQAANDLAAALGTAPSGQVFTARRARRPLSSIDLSIIDALIDQPRMPLGQLVESTGLSPKTVRKRLEQLIRTETIFIEPRLGALTDSGELVYQLAVAGRVGIGDVRRIMDQAILLHHTQEPPMKYLLCWGSDLSDVTTKTRVLKRLPGVESAVISLNKDLFVSADFEHSLVREEIRNLEDARAGQNMA